MKHSNGSMGNRTSDLTAQYLNRLRHRVPQEMCRVVLLLILQSFDYLVAFHLQLLQAILFIVV
jgi:hypothetical protein